MKKFILLSFALLNAIALSAQGIYQLWGMTPQGGSANTGVIFKTDYQGNNFKIQHQFGINNAGGKPTNTELTGYNGKFYGMTTFGGETNGGVIFEWDPATNFYTKKFDFNEGTGDQPQGKLTLKGNKFYGITRYHGLYLGGVIFEWDPATNVYTRKIDMNSVNGLYAMGSLTLKDEKFYGMTYVGGNNNGGVIFEWDPATNIYAKKIDMNVANGGYPMGNLTLKDGKFYGITYGGGFYNGGVIFEWDPNSNLYTKKVDLKQASGYQPKNASLTLSNSKFYGMTTTGGVNNAGVIFEWDPNSNLYTKKVDFDYPNGHYPTGNLTLAGGKFYGMCPNGGIKDSGVIFEWDPATNFYQTKINFVGPNGRAPLGSLAVKNNMLYGMTSGGGNKGLGVIFEWNPATNLFTKKIDFNEINDPLNGRLPGGRLIPLNGKFYGMTAWGGIESRGVIFEFDPVTGKCTKKVDFIYESGSAPVGTLVPFNGKLYGATQLGGNVDAGVIFEWDPLTNIFTKKFDFGGLNGKIPLGNLVMMGNKFYGTTTAGGSYDKGVIFEWDPATNNFVKKIDFNGTNGDYVSGSLVSIGNKLYGTTFRGGASNEGVIYEWEPATNIFTKKIDFTRSGGTNPEGSLLFKEGKCYGLTNLGGDNGNGVIFEWDPVTNVYTKKINLSVSGGGNPASGLTESGGKYYGMTNRGGSSDAGVVFEWDPVTNNYVKKMDFNLANGAYPSYNNDVSKLPAPVSIGLPGSCISFPSITINSSNNNKWVAITDNDGNAVAEIKANGNNLGVITAAMFINAGAVRQDGSNKLYLNRSITITPQTQPSTPVDIRLYIKSTEYNALKNAVNTLGQPSGITSINDLAIYKVNGNCVPAVAALTNPVTTTNSTWENDFVIAGSTSSLGSFYIASKNACTAPAITEIYLSYDTLWPPFHAYRGVSVSYRTTGDCKCGTISNWLTVRSNEPESGTGNRDLSPDWVILDQHHVRLRAERDDHGNGRVYTITINSKNTAGFISTKDVKVIVPINMIAVTAKYLGAGNKMYLPADEVYDESGFDCKVIPNPSSQYFNLQIESMTEEKIEVEIFDITGKQVSKLNVAKNQQLRFGDDLKPGVYMIKVKQGEQHKIIKVVKQ